jgi:hypothetical protein
MVFLEVVGMFSRADDIEQPAKVDEVFVTQEKTTYKVTGIGLMSGSECSYSTGRIIAGFLGLETPYGSIKLGRKEETDPLTLALKKSPSQLCFACIVPKDLKGDLSFHFADVGIPISIK